MKNKLTLTILFLMLTSVLFINSSTSNFASIGTNIGDVTTLNVDTPEFDHIYGPPGHVALAISEEDNLIFTNAPEGLALIQLDDLTNQTVYKDEIGLTDVQIQNIEIDKDLKLLYIGSIQGVDVVNYSITPLSATPILTGVATNFELGDFIDVDPFTHYVWIVTQSHGLIVYDPIYDRQVDISGYNAPASSVKMLTVDVNSSESFAFIGTSVGVFKIDISENSTRWYTSSDGLPNDYSRLVKYYPILGKIFVATFNETTNICDGISVIFPDNDTIKTYNYTQAPYYSRSFLDLVCDTEEKLGFAVSPYSTNAESGLLVFNTTSMEAVAKSYYGSGPGYPLTTVTGAPYPIESLLASIRLDSTTRKLIVGTVQRIQKIDYTAPSTAITEQSQILGLAHNMATDVNYDPVDGYAYISTLLGLDRINTTAPDRLHPLSVEHLISGIGGAGGDTAGELLVNSRVMYHHRYRYDIVSTTITNMESILPLGEYRYVADISSSYNESLIYYSTAAQNAGVGGNGSMIIYNWELGTYHVENFTEEITQLEVNSVLQDPDRDVLYVGTNTGLIIYNLTSLSEIKRFGDVENWEIQSLEWIEGKLWLGMEPYPNIRIFDPVSENTVAWDKADQITFPSINQIFYLDSRNETYILANSGLYVYNRTNQVLKTETEADGLSTFFVRRMDYVPTTDEPWIGSLQGINIYNPNYDDKNPSVTVTFPSNIVSGLIDIDVSAEDFAGIKEIRVRMENASWNQEWVISSNFLRIELDTTLYENGYYDFNVTVTDWNNLTTIDLTEDILFNNVIVVEFNKIMLYVIFPVIIGISILLKRKRFKN
ncbi:MAG: hypothetical protein HeimAB125_01300 [Candidatus Heimdallarchaeota archaeon AB_125]|nr:MAG: hypothetical protein HeimAB125_01300 [Candidatus Heimdallarchaeota archaeon AB_125]